MRIKYPTAVKESEAELRSLEHRVRGQKTADRVRMLLYWLLGLSVPKIRKRTVLQKPYYHVPGEWRAKNRNGGTLSELFFGTDATSSQYTI